jgi:predicted solute-binding protein
MPPQKDKASSEFWRALEAERYDISYRKAVRAPEIQYKIKTLTKVPERLKKVYFHAGRYSAGDRDQTAIDAHYAMEKLEG